MKNENENKKTVQLMGTTQAAKAWGITRWKLYDLIVEGKIRPITNMGKGYKFQQDDFKEDFFERL